MYDNLRMGSRVVRFPFATIRPCIFGGQLRKRRFNIEPGYATIGLKIRNGEGIGYRMRSYMFHKNPESGEWAVTGEKWGGSGVHLERNKYLALDMARECAIIAQGGRGEVLQLAVNKPFGVMVWMLGKDGKIKQKKAITPKNKGDENE